MNLALHNNRPCIVERDTVLMIFTASAAGWSKAIALLADLRREALKLGQVGSDRNLLS